MRLTLISFLFVPSIVSAAISVSGISTETSYGSGTRTVIVGNPTGFTTTATLNGLEFPVGAPVGVSEPRFYELIVTETPEGGGPAITERFLFNIRAAGRGSTETGLPAFTAAPLVNDAPSAVNTGVLNVTLPSAYPDELPLPVICRLQKENGTPLWLHSLVTSANFPQHPIQLRRGFGYTLLPPQATSTLTYNASTAGLTQNASSTISSDTSWITAGGTLATDTEWPANSRIHIIGDLTIAPAAPLTIGEGSVIKVATNGDVHVDGSLDIQGTTRNPVVFAPASAPARWGGFFLQEATSNVQAVGTIFFGGCADQSWFSTNSGYASHRKEQAVFLVGPAGATLSLTECFLIENDGQLLHNDEGGDITINRSLLQGATSCGELTGGTLTIDNSALLAFPDGTTGFEDGDNDAIYLTSGQHLISNTVIGFTKDDGIDSGGSPAAGTNTVSTVQNCWFESILHEGMSNSGAKTCNVFDSVFFNCGQTIESGYDGPQSTLARSLCVANLVGARMGDNYNWNYTNNHLTVADCLLIENSYHDIWGYDWSSWTYNTAKMTVTNNYISRAEDLARHPENTAYDPQTHGSLLAPYMPVPGSNVGIAITGIESQGTLSGYTPEFQVQLSTFSSKTVSVAYSLAGKNDPNDSSATELQNGTLVFNPGETNKTISLPLPSPSPYGLIRVSLSSPTHAEITGGEGWFFDTVSPEEQAILIPRSSAGWKYDASRTEPAAEWKGLLFDDSGWQDATAEVGFGEGDENTTLTAAEQGPAGDRTTTVYFRKTFTLADASLVSNLDLSLNRDDGAVIYLNGREVGRTNMADGTVTYATLASNADPENTFTPIPVPPALLPFLQDGENVIAVEVHQSSLTSSDLSFDLELVAAISNEVDDQRGFTMFDNKHYLFWLDPNQLLEESDDLDNWIPMSGAKSPFEVPMNAPRKFFRLRKD